MQAFYSEYSLANKPHDIKNIFESRKASCKRRDKRSPYGDDVHHGDDNENNNSSDVFFLLLTLLLLLVLYPVGLVLLWTNKCKVNVGNKLLLTLLGAIVCCFVLVYAANYPIENENVQAIQDELNTGFDWVYEKTSGALNDAGVMLETLYEDGREKLLVMWDIMDEAVAHRYLELYGYISDNVSAVKHALPEKLLDRFKEEIDYVEPTPTARILPQQLLESIGVVIETPTLSDTTPTPTPTPAPTPTPTPIAKPVVRDASEAEVFFTPNGTYYHKTKNCSGMMNAVSHTLLEAQQAGKLCCENCSVVGYEMLERDNDYMWVDVNNVAHTTDLCIEFAAGGYSLLPFEDVYQGHYTYCPVCGGDICYEYMHQNDEKYNTAYIDLDTDTKELYDYEKTITVYYGENSRKYHATKSCQQMYDAKYVHNLYEALHVDSKARCPDCLPATEDDALAQLTN